MVAPGGGLDEVQRERLIETYGRRFSAGEVIFRQDEPTKNVYVLQEGRVRLVKRVRIRSLFPNPTSRIYPEPREQDKPLWLCDSQSAASATDPLRTVSPS